MKFSLLIFQANFFMNFIMTQGWAGLAIEILQPDLLTLGLFMKYFLQKQQYGPYVQSMQYHRILPNLLLLIFIGFMYSMIAPLLIPFLMIFFIGGYIVYCNQVWPSFFTFWILGYIHKYINMSIHMTYTYV